MLLKIIFSFVNLISIIVLSIHMNILKGKKESFAGPLRMLLLSAIITIFGNIIIAMAADINSAHIGYCIYFGGMDWISMYLCTFCVKYTKHMTVYKRIRYPLAALVVLDNICIWSNLLFNHEFTLKSVTDKDGVIFYVFNSKPFYNSHLLLDYLIIGLGVAFLISKIFKSYSYYRLKYFFILFSFLAVILLNCVYLMSKQYLDWSVMLYAIAGVVLYFFAFYFTPVKLTHKAIMSAVDEMNEGLVLLDDDEQCVYANSFIDENFGISKDDINVSDERFKVFVDAIRRNSDKRIIENHVVYNEKGEEEKRYRIKIDSITDRKGHKLGKYFLVEDITEYHQAMLALERARCEADKANEYKSAFLANMSHEIRTPINAVLGMNEMVLRESEDRNILEYAQNIQVSGNALLDLINDILDFSKIEAGKMEIIDSAYSPSKMFRDILLLLSPKANEKGLSIIVDWDDNIPSVLLGDEKRIRQILINLISNAVKYTKKGRIIVSCKYEEIDNSNIELHVDVKDTGIGISTENQKILFNAFQRVDMANNRNIEGTGLGLAITSQLVSMMNGSISVKSELLKGSTFTLKLPQRVLNSAPSGSFKEEKAVEISKYKESFKAPDAKVLVVDDVPINLKVVVNLLKKTEVKIVTAGGGNAAIEECNKQKFDLILMDHMMPTPDGVEAFRVIKKEGLNTETPVVVLTANAIGGVEDEYRKIGFDGYLAKPVKGAELEKTLMRLLPANLLIIQSE